MEEFFAAHGLPALLLLSFLAATLLPVGSEWLLILLLVNGADPLPAVATATLGNTLGALTTYAIGFWGGPILVRRVLRIEEESQKKAERFYARFGAWSLLLSWLPVIGDPLCLVGGVLRVGFRRFFLLVVLGKLARYGAVALMAVEGGKWIH
jgi:membrane protein YqaA with SNARE-associated domain